MTGNPLKQINYTPAVEYITFMRGHQDINQAYIQFVVSKLSYIIHRNIHKMKYINSTVKHFY